MAEPTGTQESASFPPELERMGVTSGAEIDIRDLDTIREEQQIDIYLYFEEDLARESTLEKDIEEYSDVPDFERPFIRLDRFLQFANESDPQFAHRLSDIPLVIEILAYGELFQEGQAGTTPYVKGLMPFLDELELEDVPATP